MFWTLKEEITNESNANDLAIVGLMDHNNVDIVDMRGVKR